jgi:hypothetical protein
MRRVKLRGRWRRFSAKSDERLAATKAMRRRILTHD